MYDTRESSETHGTIAIQQHRCMDLGTIDGCSPLQMCVLTYSIHHTIPNENEYNRIQRKIHINGFWFSSLKFSWREFDWSQTILCLALPCFTVLILQHYLPPKRLTLYRTKIKTWITRHLHYWHHPCSFSTWFWPESYWVEIWKKTLVWNRKAVAVETILQILILVAAETKIVATRARRKTPTKIVVAIEVFGITSNPVTVRNL